MNAEKKNVAYGYWVVTGRVKSGSGKAASFTNLDWVQEQCAAKLGFKPYPGTLNVEVEGKWENVIDAVKGEEGVLLIPPDAGWCTGKAVPVRTENVRGALIMPSEEASIHGKRVLEVMAPVRLKSELGINDGDLVTLKIERRRRIRDKLHVAAVVFDLDGTLIDSMDVYCRILNNAMERIGLQPVPRETILTAIKEGGFDWSYVLSEETTAGRKALVKELKGVMMEIYPSTFQKEVKMIEGADAVLRQISQSHMKIGLVTSTPRALLEGKLLPLRHAGTVGLFDAVITTDDAVEKKPAADPLIECGMRLGLDPERMAYVGDAATDIQAGHAAGTKTIAVLTGLHDYAGLMSEGPDAIISSVAELFEVIALPGG